MPDDPSHPAQRRVLVTGAAGRIGSAFWRSAADRYRLRLTDRSLDGLREGLSGDHEAVAADIVDPEACRALCRGVDTVVHLAADPSPEADFYGSLLDNNVKGTYNVFRAAADAGCRRVVFASSIHAVVGHADELTVAPDAPVRPLNMYGVSKCFGEAVAACFARAEGLSSIAIRIGAYEAPWVREAPEPSWLRAFVSPRDMNQLLVRAIEAPGVDFAIVHGVSNNRVQRLDLTATRVLLGYEPQDDGFALYGQGAG